MCLPGCIASGLATNLACFHILQFELPFPLLFAPCSSQEFVTEFSESVDSVLPSRFLKVSQNLGASAIVFGPLRVALESILVGGARNVTTYSRISSKYVSNLILVIRYKIAIEEGVVLPIFPPSTTNVLVLIVNDEVKIRDPLSEPDAGEDTRQTSSDNNDFNAPIVINTVLP